MDLLHTQKRAASLSPHDMHMHMCMYCTTTWVLCVYRCSVSRVNLLYLTQLAEYTLLGVEKFNSNM